MQTAEAPSAFTAIPDETTIRARIKETAANLRLWKKLLAVSEQRTREQARLKQYDSDNDSAA
jgi:hypothetical protein